MSTKTQIATMTLIFTQEDIEETTFGIEGKIDFMPKITGDEEKPTDLQMFATHKIAKMLEIINEGGEDE